MTQNQIEKLIRSAPEHAHRAHVTLTTGQILRGVYHVPADGLIQIGDNWVDVNHIILWSILE